MFLNQFEFQRYIQTSARRANLNVRWEEGAVPSTNGKEIVLPLMDAKATEHDYRKLLHFATHESDHVLYTDFGLLKKTNVSASNSLMGIIWNGLEDHRIEWLGTREYEGDRLNSDYVYPTLVEGVATSFARGRASPNPKNTEIVDKALPLVQFMGHMACDMYPSAAACEHMLDKLESKESLAYSKKWQAGDYVEVLRNCRNIEDTVKGTAATYALAKRIFKEVYGEDPEEEEKRCQEQAKQQGKGQPKPGEGKEGEGKGKGEGTGKDGKEKGAGKGEGKGEEGEGESEGTLGSEAGKDGKPRDKMVSVDWTPAAMSPQHKLDSGEPATAGMHINYANYTSTADYEPATIQDFIISDFAKNKFTNSEMATVRTTHPAYEKKRDGYTAAYYKTKTVGANAFASRVRTRLQIRSKDRYEYGVKRGKLHQPNLYRATLENVGTLNQRVFKRKIETDTLNTAVAVLVDTSGSMSGEKYSHAMVSAGLLNDAIGNVLGIPLEITAFTDRGPQPHMFVHRDFDTKRLSEEELVRRMSLAGQWMSGNPDGDAINFAYERLRRRKEKRKVLIVLSDGSPAAGRGGDIMWYTKKVVERITKEKIVSVVGIGIMDNNVRYIYPEHYVIDNASKLEQALLALIDKKIR